MANNNILFNAAIGGAAGGIQQRRWLTDTDSNNYLALRNSIVQFAQTIDSLIPAGNYGDSEAELLANLCNAALSNRNLTLANIGASITSLAQSIVALFNSLQGQLLSVTDAFQSQIGWAPASNGSSNILTLMAAPHRAGMYEITWTTVVRTGAVGSNLSVRMGFTSP